MKIIVDRSRCDGNGNCAAEAPEAFALDSEDRLSLLIEEVPPQLRGKVEAGVRACPKRALKLVGGDSGDR